MLFGVYNPPQIEIPEVETPEPNDEALLLPASTDVVGCVTMAAFVPDYNLYPPDVEPPSKVYRGATVDGGNLVEVLIGYTGKPTLFNIRLPGTWRVLSYRINFGDMIEGGIGLVQRIS